MAAVAASATQGQVGAPGSSASWMRMSHVLMKPNYIENYAKLHNISIGEAAREVEAEGEIHDQHDMQMSIDNRPGWFRCKCGAEIESEGGCADHRSEMKGYDVSYYTTPDQRVVRSTEKVRWWTIPPRNPQ